MESITQKIKNADKRRREWWHDANEQVKVWEADHPQIDELNAEIKRLVYMNAYVDGRFDEFKKTAATKET